MTKQRYISMIEALVYTSICLAISYHLNPIDPIGLSNSFPWVWLVPVIFALQYHLSAAMCSVFTIAAFSNWVGINFLESTPHKLFITGGCILTLICSHFSAKWRKKIEALEQGNHYFEQKTQELQVVYTTLALSHQELEQKYITDQKSLRSALESLKTIDTSAIEKQAAQFLKLLSYYCTITKAGIISASGDVIAEIGQFAKANLNDPLVCHAKTSEKVVHVSFGQHAQKQSHYLLVKRFQHKEVLLYLFVEEMPFIFFNKNNLALMDILCDYWSNLCVHHANCLQVPHLPAKLQSEICYLKNAWQKHHHNSHVIILEFNVLDKKVKLKPLLHESKRGLDSLYMWLDLPQAKALFVLPFANETIVSGFLERIKSILNKVPNLNHRITVKTIESFNLQQWQSTIHLCEKDS